MLVGEVPGVWLILVLTEARIEDALRQVGDTVRCARSWRAQEHQKEGKGRSGLIVESPESRQTVAELS